MPIIVLDGPEKAGKSTLADVLVHELGAGYRHWGVLTDDTDYLRALQFDAARRELVVWDRSWAGQWVYDPFTGRNNRFSYDPWLGEWLYGRAVQRLGVAAMLDGPGPDVLAGRRDETDIVMDPAVEQARYLEYARRFGWLQLAAATTGPTVIRETAYVLARLAYANSTDARLPQVPAMAGAATARVWFVAEERNEASTYPGAWLPFSTPMTGHYGRILGSDAFRCAWTNAKDACPTCVAQRADLIVACGATAHAWADPVRSNVQVLNVPHPAGLYRFHRGSAMQERTEQLIIQSVEGALNDHGETTVRRDHQFDGRDLAG